MNLRENPEKMREYKRNWMRKRRADFFKDKKCSICGTTEKLVLHHRNPKDKISHKIWSWSEERRLAEIDKCDILCSNCHRKEHGAFAHGTRSMYKAHGCRCILCKKWRSDLWKAKGY